MIDLVFSVLLVLVTLYVVFNKHKQDFFKINDNLIISEDKPQVGKFEKIMGKTLTKIPFYINKLKKDWVYKIPNYNDFSFKGKGIVIAANGNRYKYVTGVYMNLYVIRKMFGCDLPVEIFYVGSGEKFNKKIEKKLRALGNINIIDLSTKLNTNLKSKDLIGYRTKPLAVMASSFREIILMDADSLVFVNPEILLEEYNYLNNGMLLFKDYVNCLKYVNPTFLNNIGLDKNEFCKKTHGYEIDSSCIIVDKQRAWDAICTICIINVKSSSYYGTINNVLGDKDTWLIGSMFASFKPYISPSTVGALLAPLNTEVGTKYKTVQGHLQFLKINGVFTPIYYNNQAIDLSVFDGMDDWGYTISIKNPKMMGDWDGESYPLTPQMLQSFRYASKGIKDIVDDVDVKIKSKNRFNNIVVTGML